MLGTVSLASLMGSGTAKTAASERPSHFAASAKRVIYLFQSGGPSQLKISLSPATTGEPPLPWTGEYWMESTFQTKVPSNSRQAVPWGPK